MASPPTRRSMTTALELAILRDGYVKSYEFGYVRAMTTNAYWIWRYSVGQFRGNPDQQRPPRRILAGVNITGATMRNRLIRSVARDLLNKEKQDSIKRIFPFKEDLSDYGIVTLAYGRMTSLIRQPVWPWYARLSNFTEHDMSDGLYETVLTFPTRTPKNGIRSWSASMPPRNGSKKRPKLFFGLTCWRSGARSITALELALGRASSAARPSLSLLATWGLGRQN